MPHRHAQPNPTEDVRHEQLIRREVFSPEHLEQFAEKLAVEQIASPAHVYNRLLRKRLDDASAIELFHPYTFFGPTIQNRVMGENSVHGSDSAENAANEIRFFFSDSDIVG